MPTQGFNGLRVLALESRRANEIAKLIEASGGKATVVPAMREVRLESNAEGLAFAQRLIAGDFDLVLFLTGVGVRILFDVAQTRYSRDEFLAALKRTQIIARGPKPAAVLREFGLTANLVSREPSTWREVLAVMDTSIGPQLCGLRLAVQEYGSVNTPLLDGLAERGVLVTRVSVYQWELPEDPTELQSTVHAILAGHFDVVIFLTGVQAAHLCEIARSIGKLEPVLQSLRRMVIVSIGPSTTEELSRLGLKPDFMPSHPKMGILVNQAASASPALLAQKQARERLN